MFYVSRNLFSGALCVQTFKNGFQKYAVVARIIHNNHIVDTDIAAKSVSKASFRVY